MAAAILQLLGTERWKTTHMATLDNQPEVQVATQEESMKNTFYCESLKWVCEDRLSIIRPRRSKHHRQPAWSKQLGRFGD